MTRSDKLCIFAVGFLVTKGRQVFCEDYHLTASAGAEDGGEGNREAGAEGAEWAVFFGKFFEKRD
jgi:hypothetical protein